MSNIFNDQKAKVIFSMAMKDPNLVKAPVVETILVPRQPWIRYARSEPPGRDSVFPDRGSIKGLVEFLNQDGMKNFFHVVESPPMTWALSHQPTAFEDGLPGPDGFIKILDSDFVQGLEVQRLHSTLLTGIPVEPKSDWPYIVPTADDGKVYLKYNPVFETRDADLALYKTLLYVYLRTAEAPAATANLMEKYSVVLRDVKVTVEKNALSSGTLQGLFARMADCNRIRHGLAGHPKKKGIKAAGLSFEDVAKLLEVTFPVAQVDHTKHRPLAGQLQKRLGKTTTPVNPDKLREKGEKESVIEAIAKCESFPWPQLPPVRPSSMAGPPFRQALKKGEVILGSVAIFDNFMREISTTLLGHLSDGGTNPAKATEKIQDTVNKYWFLFCGYVFPKTEVYPDSKYYGGTRYIYGASTPAFLSINAFLDPIVEQPVASAVSVGPSVTPSLYKFSPYKGKLDQVLAQSIVTMIDQFERAESKPSDDPHWIPRVGLIYADNLYFMTLRPATTREVEAWITALTELWPDYTDSMRVTEYDILLDMAPNKWVALLAWMINNGQAVTYASVDITKCEANVTQDVVQAFVYYLLTRGWVKEGAPYFNPIWMFYLMNIMPSMVVDCYGIIYNQLFKIPGEGSGHGLTTQCNWIISSLVYAVWMKLDNPLSYAGSGSELSNKVAEMFGYEFKVEYEELNFTAAIMESMLSSKGVFGWMFGEFDFSEAQNQFGGDAIPWGPHLPVANLKLDLLGFDAVYSPESETFIPVLAYDRLLKSFMFPKNEPRPVRPKKKRPGATSAREGSEQESEDETSKVERMLREATKGSELATTRAIYSIVRLHGLYLAGGWSNPMICLAIQSRIKSVSNDLRKWAYDSDGDIIPRFVEYAAKIATENDISAFTIDQVSLDAMIQSGEPPFGQLRDLHDWDQEEYFETLRNLKPTSTNGPEFLSKTPTNSKLRDVVQRHYRELTLKNVIKKDGTKKANFMDTGIFPTLVMSVLAGKGLSEAMSVVQQYKDLPKGATDAQKEAAFKRAVDADNYMRHEAIKAMQVTVLTGLVFEGAVATAVPDQLKKKRKTPVVADIMAEATKGPLSKKRRVSGSGGRL